MALLNTEYEFYDPKTREQWQFTFSMPYWHNDKPAIVGIFSIR
jgi:hypothetical protein